MFLPASASLPILPPPFTSILSAHDPSSLNNGHDQFSTSQPSPRRPNSHLPHPSSLRNPNSLQNLLLDEVAISSRKTAISTYGYSWLRPAGVAKTMLGRREEDAEREELERQMREQEEMEQEMERGEELARQTRLREQQGQGGPAQGEEVEQRDLDDEIPDANVVPMQHGDDGERRGDADLDDEIPDADAENSFGDEDDDVEGETGITDEVEHTNLGEGDTSRPTATQVGYRGNQHPTTRQLRGQEAQATQQAFLRRRDQEQAEQEALANAMLDEDEQALADRDLDTELPTEDENGMPIRDLDDDVPEADDDEEIGEGEWQHTDTELDEDESGMMLMEDEGDVSMDMSVGGGRRSVSGNVAAATTGAGTVFATPGSSMIQTPTTGDTRSGGRGWLGRRSLSGRGRTGNLFAGIIGRGTRGGAGIGSPQAPTLIPPQIEPDGTQETALGHGQQPQPQPRRRSGRSGLGSETRSARESLD